MTATAERPQTTIFKRPSSTTGIWSWLTTVDHKRIGIMYGMGAMFFLVIGGLEAVLIRLQLAGPDGTVLSADYYNQMFTMHATTMVFLFVMPASAAFMNYLIPLMIGARDVAFPRLNALSWWIFFFGGIFLYSTFIFGTSVAPIGPDGIVGNLPAGGGPGSLNFLADSPDGGWFGYQPNAGPFYSPGTAMDYWALGLQIIGLASLVSSVNFIVRPWVQAEDYWSVWFDVTQQTKERFDAAGIEAEKRGYSHAMHAARELEGAASARRGHVAPHRVRRSPRCPQSPSAPGTAW